MRRVRARRILVLVVLSGLFVSLLAVPVRALTQDYFPGTETATKGSVGGAAFPGAIQTSDDSYRTPQEANTAPSGSDVAPDTEQLIRGTSSGFANLLADDAANWVGTEAAVGGNTQQLTPASSTTLKGTQTAGTVPTCTDASDDSRCTWQEADQAAAPTDLTPDTETVTTGTKVSGTFNADVTSDNGAIITYREASSVPSQTLAFDAAVEFERTLTTDPQTWSHVPVGTPRGILVGIGHGTESTDCIVSVTYGGVGMSRVNTATDTLTEPGRVYMYFLGASIPTGTQTVSADIAAAGACSTTDMEFVSLSYTAAADTQVLTSATDAENQADPTATLAYSGRQAMAAMVFYSGIADVSTATLACSGSSACSTVHFFDIAAFGARVDRQTTRGSTNQVMGYTVANDDVALVYVAITQTDSTPVYRIEVKYDWTTETCTDTRRLTVNAWHTNTESILVQVYPASEGAPTTRLTVTATADGTTLTYDLTTDEWDSGDPNIRFLGNEEVTDPTQTDLLVDYVTVSCIPAADYQVEVKLSWTGISTTGTEWRLFLEGREGASNPEQMDVKIYAADEVALSAIVCSITSTTEASYDCGTLTTDQLDGGSPDILILDATRTPDTTQSTVDIDYARVQRTFNRYELQQAHKWVTTVAAADHYALQVRASRSDENLLVQLWDWTGSSWTTRITVNAGSETLFTYTLVSTERASNGTVMVRWLGSSETSSDETQSTVTADQEIVQRSFNTNYEVEIRYGWTGVATSGNSWTLVVECKRVTNPENGLIQVVDSTETTWTTRYTCNADTDTTYSTYALTADELDGGTPDVRLLGATESGDGSQSTWDLDLVKIVRDYTPANSPPTLTQSYANPYTITRAQSVDFGTTYTDVDNNAPTYMKVTLSPAATNRTLDENNTGDTVYTDGKTYHLTDPANTYCPGVQTFFFSTSDGTYSIRSPSQTLTITNTVPAITNGGGQPTSVVHGNVYSYDFDATDVDVPVCQTLTWSKPIGPAWLSINPSTGVLSGTAPDNTGSAIVRVRVSDGAATNDYGNFGISITNANPTWTANSPPLTVHHGDPYSYDFDAADTDPLDYIYYTKDAGPAWLGIDQGTGVYSGTAPHTLSGGGSNTVTVRDQAIPNGTAQHVWSITITNENPAFTAGVQTLESSTTGTAYLHDYDASDASGDYLYFTFTTDNPDLSLGPLNGTVWGMLAQEGVFYVDVVVHDDASPNGTAENNYTLTVDPAGGADPIGGVPIHLVAASFTAQAAGAVVHFFDASESSVIPRSSWHWDFGDGGTSEEQNPVHAYDVRGLFRSYEVTLKVCNADACDTQTRTIIVWNVPLLVGLVLLIGASLVVLEGARPRRPRPRKGTT